MSTKIPATQAWLKTPPNERTQQMEAAMLKESLVTMKANQKSNMNSLNQKFNSAFPNFNQAYQKAAPAVAEVGAGSALSALESEYPSLDFSGRAGRAVVLEDAAVIDQVLGKRAVSGIASQWISVFNLRENLAAEKKKKMGMVAWYSKRLSEAEEMLRREIKIAKLKLLRGC